MVLGLYLYTHRFSNLSLGVIRLVVQKVAKYHDYHGRVWPCKHCGAPIESYSPRKYCSTDCRNEYVRVHAKATPAKTLKERRAAKKLEGMERWEAMKKEDTERARREGLVGLPKDELHRTVFVPNSGPNAGWLCIRFGDDRPWIPVTDTKPRLTVTETKLQDLPGTKVTGDWID